MSASPSPNLERETAPPGRLAFSNGLARRDDRCAFRLADVGSAGVRRWPMCAPPVLKVGRSKERPTIPVRLSFSRLRTLRLRAWPASAKGRADRAQWLIRSSATPASARVAKKRGSI
jgi:hypothetical protein